jgi:hypothetical protein
LNKFEIAQILYLRPEKVDVAIALIPRCVPPSHFIIEPGVPTELIIVWNDIVKERMKINYKRYWMKSRISLDSVESRPYGLGQVYKLAV